MPAFSRRHPLRFAPYVQVPGADLAVEFFLRFGGSEVHFARDSCHGGAATSMIGVEKIATLGARLCIIRKRIPLAIRWIAEGLTQKGCPIAGIARWIRVSDVTLATGFPENTARFRPKDRP